MQLKKPATQAPLIALLVAMASDAGEAMVWMREKSAAERVEHSRCYEDLAGIL